MHLPLYFGDSPVNGVFLLPRPVKSPCPVRKLVIYSMIEVGVQKIIVDDGIKRCIG